MDIEQRVEARTATALEAVVSVDGERIACRVKDISSRGAKIVKINAASPLTPGAQVSLRLDPLGSILGEVAWSSEDTSGLKFTDRPENIESVLLGLASYAMV